MFNEEKVNQWAKRHNLDEYYQCNLNDDDMSKFMSDEMDQYGRARFYLLHTFSHIIMKEMEFSCGYPTAKKMNAFTIQIRCAVFSYTLLTEQRAVWVGSYGKDNLT